MAQNLTRYNSETTNKLVIQDDALILASYTLSLDEQRLILAAIEKAHNQNNTSLNNSIEITITASEYAKLYNVELGTAYKALSHSSDKLYERTILIDSEGKTEKVRWLQKTADYESGKIKILFTDIISRHIRGVVTTQTAYRLAQASKLRSSHSIRLFAIFQTVIDPNTQKGEWEVSISDFKEILDIKDLYERWVDLKKRIIIPALQLITKDTSLQVSWEIAGKEGRKVSKLKFLIIESEQLTLKLK